jgi:hypothetical protein
MIHKGNIASSMDNINEYCNELEGISASRAINTGMTLYIYGQFVLESHIGHPYGR